MNGDKDEEFKLRVKYVSEIIQDRIDRQVTPPSDEWRVQQFDKLWEESTQRLKILNNIIKIK